MKPSMPGLSLLVLCVGLLNLGCTPVMFQHNADLGLPFEALPQTAGQSCLVFFYTEGVAGRVGDHESYVEKTAYVSDSRARARERFFELLHHDAEEVRPGDQTIGRVHWEEWTLNPFSVGRATEQSFMLYASCLTEEGAFFCSGVPMEVQRRNSVTCPFSPFPFGEANPPVAAPEAIEVEYTSIPCKKEHGVYRKSCRGGWFIKLHQIRLDGG